MVLESLPLVAALLVLIVALAPAKRHVRRPRHLSVGHARPSGRAGSPRRGPVRAVLGRTPLSRPVAARAG